MVNPVLTAGGRAAFVAATKELATNPADNPRRRLAIVIDGVVASAPGIAQDVDPEEGLPADTIVLTIGEGPRAEARARAVAAYLHFGPLRVALEIRSG